MVEPNKEGAKSAAPQKQQPAAPSTTTKPGTTTSAAPVPAKPAPPAAPTSADCKAALETATKAVGRAIADPNSPAPVLLAIEYSKLVDELKSSGKSSAEKQNVTLRTPGAVNITMNIAAGTQYNSGDGSPSFSNPNQYWLGITNIRVEISPNEPSSPVSDSLKTLRHPACASENRSFEKTVTSIPSVLREQAVQKTRELQKPS